MSGEYRKYEVDFPEGTFVGIETFGISEDPNYSYRNIENSMNVTGVDKEVVDAVVYMLNNNTLNRDNTLNDNSICSNIKEEVVCQKNLS